MRKDMAKVIVERPRRNRNHTYGDKLRNSRKHDLSEDAPTKESIRKPHKSGFSGKELNENLNPLKAYLRKQVGRPWDKVYSELNEHVSVTNAVQAHVRQHLPYLIELNPLYDEDGNPCTIGFSNKLLKLGKGQLYVEKGIIKAANPKSAKFKAAKGYKRYIIVGVPRDRPEYRCSVDKLGNSHGVWTYTLIPEVISEETAIEMGILSKALETFIAPSYASACEYASRSQGSWRWNGSLKTEVYGSKHTPKPGVHYFPK